MPLPLLATPGDLFDYLQQPVPDEGEQGSAIAYLRSASSLVRAYLRQEVTWHADDVYVVQPEWTPTGLIVFLPEGPVRSVASVEALDAYGAWVDATEHTWLDLGAGALSTTSRWTWPGGYPIDGRSTTWRVTYTHGWEEVPPGIVAAVVQVAGAAFASPAGVEQETIGGYTVRYAAGRYAAQTASGLPHDVEAALAPFRMPVVA